jgi:chloramphenicol-sensitive protein RarD
MEIVMNKMMRPYLLVLSAYCVWGILPLYWELLSEVSPKLLLVMRAVLSALLLICFELRSGTFLREIKSVLSLRQSFFVVLASLLLLGNWWSYLIAIEQGRFICASLAYFICPMVTFILGYLVLGGIAQQSTANWLFDHRTSSFAQDLAAGRIPGFSIVHWR